VRDVERRDPVAAAQLAHGLEHHALGGDVQAGGRLVQHQHLGPRQERHRQRDALHLAAGELVRVSGEELVVVGQADLAQARAGALERSSACRSRAARAARRSGGRSGSPG
jgi:hypothetical protein